MPRLEWKNLLRLLVLAAACLGAHTHGHPSGHPRDDTAGSFAFREHALPDAAPGGRNETQAPQRFVLPPPTYQGGRSLAQLLLS